MKIDNNPKRTQTQVSLHVLLCTFESDLRYMVFDGNMLSLKLLSNLNLLSPSYTSLDEWLGYGGKYDEERYSRWNLRPYTRLEQKKSGPAGTNCDRDHCIGRNNTDLILHSKVACID